MDLAAQRAVGGLAVALKLGQQLQVELVDGGDRHVHLGAFK
jgi:hypothetical protein